MISLEKLEDFRSHILDLAIRGKLVEQRPEDGTAEDLYLQIQEEKAKLIKEGKIKKEKSLSPVDNEDETIFDLPKSWKWVRLSSLCSIISDGTHQTPEYVKKGTPFLSVKDISSGQIDFSNTKFISETDSKALNKRSEPEVGDILVCRIGTLGKALKIPQESPKFSIFVSLGLIKTVNKEISDFIAKVINSPYGYNWIQLVKVGGGTHTAKINLEDLRNFIVPLPPLAEQKRIVAKVENYLSVIDNAEELLRRKVDLDGQIKEKILQMAIQGKLVERRPEDGTAEDLYQQIQEEKANLIKEGKLKKEKPLAPIADDEIPFDIPDSWRWVRVADLIQVLNGDRGKNYPSKDKLKEKGIPFVSASNLDGKTVVKDSNLKCLSEKQYSLLRAGKLQKDDILVCIRGSLGKCATYPFDKGAIASSLIICRPYIQKKPEITDYVMNYLKSNLFYSEISKYDNGTAQPNLAAKDFCKFLLPLPPLAEQKRIVAKVEELLALCDKLKLK